MPKKAPYTLPPLSISRKDIGKNIAKVRKDKGLTQIELAEKIGITQNLISDYETGRSTLSSEMVIRLALELQTPSDILLGLDDSKIVNEDELPLRYTRRIREIDKLSANKKRAILQMLDDMIKANNS